MFQAHAGNLKRKYWWKNMKMWLILIGMGIIFLLIIILKMSSGGDDSENTPIIPQGNTAALTDEQKNLNQNGENLDQVDGVNSSKNLRKSRDIKYSVFDTNNDVNDNEGEAVMIVFNDDNLKKSQRSTKVLDSDDEDDIFKRYMKRTEKMFNIHNNIGDYDSIDGRKIMKEKIKKLSMKPVVADLHLM